MNIFYILFVIFILILLVKKEDNNFKRDSSLILLRQAARWSLASIQDMNPFIAVLHANYAAGYLWALKDIYTDLEIKNYTGIDMKEFILLIVKNQDIVSKRLVKVCPNFVPERNLLTQIAGQS
jgi:hypothetical protein